MLAKKVAKNYQGLINPQKLMTKCDFQEKLAEYSSDKKGAPKTFKKDHIDIKIGEEVLAVFSLDTFTYRARVIEVSEENLECQVYFYDFGNIDTCSFDKVFVYDDENFNYLPAMVSLTVAHLVLLKILLKKFRNSHKQINSSS